MVGAFFDFCQGNHCTGYDMGLHAVIHMMIMIGLLHIDGVVDASAGCEANIILVTQFFRQNVGRHLLSLDPMIVVVVAAHSNFY